MDPDAALREIRAIMALIKAHRRMTEEQLDHLAELFDGLDQYLTQGGFSPVAWQHARHPLFAAQDAWASEHGGC